MDQREMRLLQALPLDIKIAKSKLRIEEWVRHFGEEGVYISFSGGKDSTVLLHMVRSLYPNIPAVFVDTGLEFPELKEFVKRVENVTTLRPSMTFKEVIEKHGYPMISKEQARFLWDVRFSTEKMRRMRLEGNKDGRYKLSKKYHYLVDAPFTISNRCCDIMKKNPTKKYVKETGRVPFIGTMAAESSVRERIYMRQGCNAFETKNPSSTPLGFWTEQDVLHYIKQFDLEIASVYGDIVESVDGTLFTTGEKRTGCIFCGFGAQLEKGETRYQRLERTHPKLHYYCMEKLGFKDVCDYMGIQWKTEPETEEQLSLLE